MTTVTETDPYGIRLLFRPGVLERGLKILAQGLAERSPKTADPIFALAAQCEAAAKRFDVAADAHGVAESAAPRDKAAVDETFRLQCIASDEFRDAALPLIWAKATTAAGLLAKARALKIAGPLGDWTKKIEKALDAEGVWDPDATLYSLIRDLDAIADAAVRSGEETRQ
jgi:hypothetical protein